MALLKDEVKRLFFDVLTVSALTGVGSTAFLMSGLAEEAPGLVPYAKSAAVAGWGTILVLLTGVFLWSKRRESWFILMQVVRLALSKCVTGLSARFGFLDRFFGALPGLAGAGRRHRTSGPLAPGLPPLSLLPDPPVELLKDQRTGAGYARRIPAAFRRCGLAQPKGGKGEPVRVVSYQAGPAATRVTVSLPDGFRLSQLKNASDDLCAALGAPTLQVMAGRRAGTANLIIGHQKRLPVYLRPALEHPDFERHFERAKLPFLVGVNDIGDPIFSDLVRVRHLLVGGATGSGKSWWLNQLLTTLLLLKTPEEMRLVLIDPKKVEMAAYHETVHTLALAVEVEDAVKILQALVREMDVRYRILQQAACRNVQQYHSRFGTAAMPYVVCMIDELADLMVQAKRDVEPAVQRLAQLARAAGIHLVVATQRPSVDVVTGVIKANLPSRIVFRLLSQADYSTILSENPNTSLGGNGDGLALIEGEHGFIRFQGAGVGGSDDDIERAIRRINDFWRSSGIDPATVRLGEPAAGMDSGGPMEVLETAKTPADNGANDELVDVPPLPEPDPDLDPGLCFDEKTRLKLVIANTGETRLEKLRAMMGLRMARLVELMQDLAAEGWLEAPPPGNPRAGYRLLLSSEARRDFIAGTGGEFVEAVAGEE